jgi:rsbT antagonist protein RsbS
MTMDRVPLVRIGEVLLVALQMDIGDRLASTLQDDIARAIIDQGCRCVLIDISALEIVDTFMCRTIAVMAKMFGVLDAETVVVGMRPAVAITVIELGMNLQGVRTALTVEQGLAVLGHRVQSPARQVDSDGSWR